MEEKRTQLIEDIKNAIADKKNEHEILLEAIKLIDAFSGGFDWTGFYILKDGLLEVGPYVGSETPHTKIELNSGICGAAVSQKKTIVVDDVNADPRFLACSISTKSEIVVPMMDGDDVVGEIDIDSNQPAFFTDDDKVMLEEVAVVVVNKLKDNK